MTPTDLTDGYAVYAFAAGSALMACMPLKQCGNWIWLARENIMKEAANIKNLQGP